MATHEMRAKGAGRKVRATGIITIDGQTFRTKKALAEHVRAIRSKYPDGATVAAPDDRFLYHFVKRHPEHAAKFAPGIWRFIVENDGRGGRGFRAITTTGVEVTFSYITCVSGKMPSADHEAREAARSAVVEQIVTFRDQALAKASVCALCFTDVTAKTCHVDHRAPFTFSRLWDEFKRRRPHADLGTVEINNTKIGVRRFTCGETAEGWSYFHHRHARLRLLCVQCNLSAARRSKP